MALHTYHSVAVAVIGTVVYGNVTLSYLQYGVWYNMVLDVQVMTLTSCIHT